VVAPVQVCYQIKLLRQVDTLLIDVVLVLDILLQVRGRLGVG
jgi:hypothetical protein